MGASWDTSPRQTGPASRAGSGMKVQHRTTLQVGSWQTGCLSGWGLQVSELHTVPFNRAVGLEPAGRPLCRPGVEGFLGSVRSRSCLREAPSWGEEDRACANPSRWVQQAGTRVLAPGTGGGYPPSPGLPLSSCLHTCFLPKFPPASRCYLFLHLECVGLGSRAAACCCLAKRMLAVERSLSRWRSSSAEVHVWPGWNTPAADLLLGTAVAFVRGLRWQKVAQAESLAPEHSQRLGRERRRRLGGFPRP